MQVKVDIDPKYTTEKLEITAPCMTEEISRIVSLCNKSSSSSLAAKKDDKIVLVAIDDIYRIYAEGRLVIAKTNSCDYRLSMRLYEVEEQLTNTTFVRISKSELVNLQKVDYFETSFSGTLRVVFKNGDASFVSRRQVKSIKERLGV